MINSLKIKEMAITAPFRNKIQILKKEYDALSKNKDSLLQMIDESEIPESVYNSNAIENSTLTLKETEQILLEMEVDKKLSLREVYEAKNLAKVNSYIKTKAKETDLTEERILFLHKMLINDISDNIAGRFRAENEYVMIGNHIGTAPEHISAKIKNLLVDYTGDFETFFVDKIARFHLEFESIHPFNDGNGRIGRGIINYQFLKLGFPPIIIRNKEKQHYYQAFNAYDDTQNTKLMEKIIVLALMESLHKRLAYLKGQTIVRLSTYAKTSGKTAPAIFNAAKRQDIPAFREKGIWKIGINLENLLKTSIKF